MKRVLILTDDEIELLLGWGSVLGPAEELDEDDAALLAKLSAAKLPA